MAGDRTTRDLSDRHELFLAELFGGNRTRGSGNQSNQPLDVRMDRSEPFALGFEGKSTRKASLSVPLATWTKLVEQAHGLRPALALRFYADDNRLAVVKDLVVLDAHDLAELMGK